MKKIIEYLMCGVLFVFPFFLCGCEDTDLQLATEAGLDAVRAVTLSDGDVRSLAQEASQFSDEKNSIAPPDHPHARRLRAIVGDHLQQGELRFDYKVYLSSEVNAFAMADGTIRVYSGLMEMMDDNELRFVIGHEMGHVALNHIRKKIQLAYAGSALRKAIASQNNLAGDLARSSLGAFVEKVASAQFSQQEEREADDFGLAFLGEHGYPAGAAVRALRKLATLGNSHSFLSSHPAPGERASRLERVLEQS